MIIVERGDPHHPQATALLRDSHTLMESLFPQEDNFYLDIDDLTAPHIRFFVARDSDTTLGTGALAIKHGFGEVKSMFVAPAARGRGIADAILRQIEDEARAEDLPVLKLETGDALKAAHRLYTRHGFAFCDAFPPYENAQSSLFMEKALTSIV